MKKTKDSNMEKEDKSGGGKLKSISPFLMAKEKKQPCHKLYYRNTFIM